MAREGCPGKPGPKLYKRHPRTHSSQLPCMAAFQMAITAAPLCEISIIPIHIDRGPRRHARPLITSFSREDGAQGAQQYYNVG